MASLTSNSLFSSMIILSCSLFILSCHVPVGEGTGFPDIQLVIENDLGGNIPMQLHCKSRNDDIGGWHDLTYHEIFTWTFKPNWFWKSTLFWCTMQWKSATGWVTGSFVVYDEYKDWWVCQPPSCLWSIRADGAYIFNQQTRKYELRHAWW